MKSLSIVNKAVSVKASLPILGNILFSAKDGVFSLSSSNLETSISVTLHASIEEDGSLAVPAKLFNEFIASMPSTNLDLVTDGSSIKVVGGGSSAKFSCMSADDFPSPPSASSGLGLSFSAKDFNYAVQSCAFCAAVSDSRPALTGILLKKHGEEFIVVATDGFRLSEKITTFSADSPDTEDFNLLLPAKTLSEVSRMFVSSEEYVKLLYSESENLAVFECGPIKAAIRVLDGEFPDYRRIIPSTHNLTARVKTDEFFQAIKITNVFARDAKEGNNLLRLSLAASGDCTIYSATAQRGEGATNIKMEVDAEEKQILAFNSKYLLDFLNNVKCEQLEIYTNGESSPCLFRSPNIENFLHLIMPVKLNS